MVEVLKLAVSLALCLVPYVALLVVTAILGTRRQRRSAKRLRAAVEAGEYGEEQRPGITRQIRAIVSASLAALFVLLSLVALGVLNLVAPSLVSQLAGSNNIATFFTVALVVAGGTALVLWVLVGRILDRAP
jgi:hypothetical protein